MCDVQKHSLVPCASQTKFLSHFRHRHACQVFATPTNPCACHAFHNVSHAAHLELQTGVPSLLPSLLNFDESELSFERVLRGRGAGRNTKAETGLSLAPKHSCKAAISCLSKHCALDFLSFTVIYIKIHECTHSIVSFLLL